MLPNTGFPFLDTEILPVQEFSNSTFFKLGNLLLKPSLCFLMQCSKLLFEFKKGYHTPSRGRAVYVDGERIELPKGDSGGEHD